MRKKKWNGAYYMYKTNPQRQFQHLRAAVIFSLHPACLHLNHTFQLHVLLQYLSFCTSLCTSTPAKEVP